MVAATPGPTPPIEDRWLSLDPPVHYLWRAADAPAPADAPTVLLVHGLGGSSANWLALMPLLRTRDGRRPHVIVPDLPGFGLSSARPERIGMSAYAEMLATLLTAQAHGPALVLGNSMGALVALLLADRHPELVSGLGLIDLAQLPKLRHRPDPLVSALFGAYFVPGLGAAVVGARRRARTPVQLTEETFRLILSDPAAIDPSVFQAHLRIAEHRATLAEMPTHFAAAARSMARQLRRLPDLADSVEASGLAVLVLHGRRDRLVPVRAARELVSTRAGWVLREHPEAGHLPQLEAPEWTADRIAEWWSA